MDYGEYAEALANAEQRVHEAEDAAKKFYSRQAYLENEVINEDIARKRPSWPAATKIAVDIRLSKDAKAQSALSDNRWHVACATMYATLAVAKQNEIIIAQNGQIIAALKALGDK